MQFSVLASGSTGNSLYVEHEGKGYLIDAGLSAKRMTEQLTAIGRSIDDVEAVFVTHEHSDHIKGVGVLARKYKLPIYANEKTWAAMSKSIGHVPSDLQYNFKMESVESFGGLQIESFGVSHDAADPMFYTMHANDRKLAIITDTGYVSDRMKGIIQAADAFVFESNHDVGMLQMCRYPWSVKHRILSDVGHVSNEDAAVAMSDVIGDKETKIFLAHLSKDNNMKELARMTVSQILESFEVPVGQQVQLFDTDPNIPTKLMDV